MNNLLNTNYTIAKLVKATKTVEDYEIVKKHYEKRIKQETKNAELYNNGILDTPFTVARRSFDLYRRLLQEKNKSYVFFGFGGY